jgi:hypothetical protein
MNSNACPQTSEYKDCGLLGYVYICKWIPAFPRKLLLLSLLWTNVSDILIPNREQCNWMDMGPTASNFPNIPIERIALLVRLLEISRSELGAGTHRRGCGLSFTAGSLGIVPQFRPPFIHSTSFPVHLPRHIKNTPHSLTLKFENTVKIDLLYS